MYLHVVDGGGKNPTLALLSEDVGFHVSGYENSDSNSFPTLIH